MPSFLLLPSIKGETAAVSSPLSLFLSRVLCPSKPTPKSFLLSPNIGKRRTQRHVNFDIIAREFLIAGRMISA